MAPHWQKHLYRAADLIFEIPPLHTYGLTLTLNHLLLLYFFHSLNTNPGNCAKPGPSLMWSGCCVECGRRVLAPKALFCANFGHRRENLITCHRTWCPKCYRACNTLDFHINDATNEVGAVWRRKGDKDRFLTARDGDMWCAPFQCEWCWFYNLQGREVVEGSSQDTNLLKYIRRVNLDIMWSQEPATIQGNLTQIRKLRDLPLALGMQVVHIPRGPWPVGDPYGFKLAIIMLKASQGKGKHDPDYVQYDTVRKIRSGLSNAYETSAEAEAVVGVLKGERGRNYRRWLGVGPS